MSTTVPVSRARLVAASNQKGGQVRLGDSDGDLLSSRAQCKLTNNISNTDDRPYPHRYQSQCTLTSKQQNHSNVSNQPAGSSPLERFITILLPFIFVFLLPTIKLTQPDERSNESATTRAQSSRSLLEAGHLFGPTSGPATSDLLLALIRLPFDKIRLQSAGLVLAAEAKEIISSKSDLQEEETHMMLLAPAEHRSGGYNGPGGGGGSQGAPTNYHYSSGGESGSGTDAHAQAAAPGDYGPEPADQPSAATSGSGGGQGEPTVVAESASSGASQLQTRSDLPAVRALNVKCEKNHMTVNIVFDRPFYGMVFSKGHYNDQKCVHLPPNSGQTSVNFDIHLGKCGMSSSDAGSAVAGSASNELQRQQQVAGSGQQPNGVFIENTIIIQYDPLVQEIYDQARKLRCTWYDYYEKSVTFRPYNVDMLDAVTANFLGDNIQCWMQIQVGKGPWSSEVAGIVKIGQTMSMVLAIKDDENRFDMLVRNCVAHDGKHQPIQLVDEYGCVARPKIMGKFQKVRNFGSTATVVSYAHFQAFKFPDSMNVHFQCVIQVCRYECPEPVCNQPAGELAGGGGGGGGNSLGGPSGQGGAGSVGGDYATSGTEMVASKELVPHPHNQAGYFNPTGASSVNSSSSLTHSLHHHPHHQHHGSNVNLKLDESQGRVQVKLDTSMLAALGSNGRPPMVAAAPQAQGPLPPHLLYANQQEQTPTRGFLSSGAFNRPPASSSVGLHSQTVGLNAPGRHHLGTSSMLASPSAGNSISRSQAAHEQHGASFSPQFPTGQMAASRRSAAYTSRLGEMPAGDENTIGGAGSEGHGNHAKQPKTQLQHALDQLAPYEAEYPLSLIASPRGFRLGPLSNGDSAGTQQLGVHPLHRVKRAEDQSSKPASAEVKPLMAGGNSKRQSRDSRAADSTSVQTHKSIQVVSPDDVAFSLLDPDESQLLAFPTTVNEGTSRRKITALDQVSANSVCFSASRFLWAVLVTLTTLISSIVIVTYVILRQRSQLEEKLSTVYVADQFQAPQGLTFNYHTTPMVSQGTSPQPLMAQQSPSPSSSGGYCHLGNGSAATMAALERQLAQQTICSDNNNINHKRQQDEVQQRNKYLARLYSQFSPASYWR